MKSKRETAEKFIESLRTVDVPTLHNLILQEAGEELSQFMLAYAAGILAKKVATVDTLAGLVLIGYLVRAQEERVGGDTGKMARA